jgi:hypothetical protein
MSNTAIQPGTQSIDIARALTIPPALWQQFADRDPGAADKITLDYIGENSDLLDEICESGDDLELLNAARKLRIGLSDYRSKRIESLAMDELNVTETDP